MRYLLGIIAILALLACNTVDDSKVSDVNAPIDGFDANIGDIVTDDVTTPSDRTCSPVVGKPPLSLESIATKLGWVTDVAFAPGDDTRIYVVLQTGIVRVLNNGANSIFLDISKTNVLSGNEWGLLGLTFHPKFPATPYFYIYYTRKPDGHVVIERFSVDGALRVQPASQQILVIPQPASNHNGGTLKFGPDGYLYIAVGDGGGGGDDRGGPIGNAQDLTKLLGKILRIDIDKTSGGKNYVIPSGNPFTGQADKRDEILHLGLRNPFRISFDRKNGDLWIGDVGQNAFEEVSLAPANSSALNFGWVCKEASHDYKLANRSDQLKQLCPTIKATDPILEIAQTDAIRSVIMGFRYRGCRMPGYHDTVFLTDFYADRLWSFDWDGSKATSITKHSGLRVRQVTTFGENNQGELYIGTLSGNLFKLVPKGSN